MIQAQAARVFIGGHQVATLAPAQFVFDDEPDVREVVPVGGPSFDFSVELETRAASFEELQGILERGSHDVTFDLVLPEVGLRAKVRHIEPPPRVGASLETLRRRVQYGGRKGRSAARRLRRDDVFSFAGTVESMTGPFPLA